MRSKIFTLLLGTSILLVLFQNCARGFKQQGSLASTSSNSTSSNGTPATPETPAPPAPPPPQDKTGLIFSDDFEGGNFSGWDDVHGSLISANHVHTGNKAMAFCYGCPGFGAGGNTLKEIPKTKRVYLSFYWYFPTGYYMNWRVGGHPFRIRGDKGSALDTEYQSNMNMVVFGNCVGGSCEIESLYNGVPTNFSTNKWYKVEIDFRLNSAGMSDGFLKVSVDGVVKLNSTGRKFSNQDEYLNEVWITSNDDNCVGGASACTTYIDDVQIWNAPPP